MTRFAPTVFSFVRTPGHDLNPTTLGQRANGFAAQVRDCSSATMIVHKSAAGMNGWLVLTGHDDTVQKAAIDLAQAVGARAEVAELPDSLLDSPGIARARYVPTISRETLLHTDPTEIARRLEVKLRVDDWVALTLRAPTTREDRRNRDWTDFRYGQSSAATHQSRVPGAMVVSMFAGSADGAAAAGLLDYTASVMQGFDARVSGERVSLLRGVAPFAASAVVSLLMSLVLTGRLLSGTLGLPSTDQAPLLGQIGSLLLGVAIVSLGLTLAKTTGLLPTLWHRVRRGLLTGVLPSPPTRRRRPRSPREESLNPKTGKKVRSFEGDYPLHSSAFLVAPIIFIGLTAPYAETAVAASSSRSRAVPPQVTVRRGPLIGFNNDARAHLSMSDIYTGVAIIGEPGSGKSGLTRTLFGFGAFDWSQPTTLSGANSSRNTVVVFESKGDGVEAYLSWAKLARIPFAVVDVADSSKFAIDMFATQGNVAQRAEAFVNGLVYAFSEGAIQDLGFTSLQSIYTAAITLAEDPTLSVAAEGVSPGRSPHHYANALVGNLGDHVSVLLYNEIHRRSVDAVASSEPLRLAAAALAPYFAGVTASKRSQLFQSSQNKIKQLAGLESYWGRPNRVTWDQILSPDEQGRHRTVVINTGDSASGQQVEEKLSEIMAALLLYTLQRAIRFRCNNWFESGKSVTIYADELSMLTGSSPEVLTWMKDKGRSYGVRPVFATQRPEQLPNAVRDAFLSFGHVVAFRQSKREIAAAVASRLSATEGEVTSDEIIHLTNFTAMVSTRVNGELLPPFTIQIPHFESDRTGASVEQGFVVDQPVTASPLAPPPAPVYQPPAVVPGAEIAVAPSPTVALPISAPVASPMAPPPFVRTDRLTGQAVTAIDPAALAAFDSAADEGPAPSPAPSPAPAPASLPTIAGATLDDDPFTV